MTHTPVAGYRSLPQETLDAMNRNKAIEEVLLRQMELDGRDETIQTDTRWMSIARTHLEQSFMAYNRALAKPGRIAGDFATVDGLLGR